jgi:DNA-binding LacI/PurR family transcriptional regulator
VARLARVDPAIVSRVLNADKALSIRNETRERVLTAVSQLNYRPNVIARSLKLRASYALGMLLPDIANPMFPDIIKGVEDVAEVQGFHILLAHITSQALAGGRHLELLRESRVGGLIVATGALSDSAIEELRRSGFPYVLVNRRAQGIDRYVVVDDEAGARLAVEHLIALGHRRIAHLAGPLDTDTGQRRLAGYRQALRAEGVEPDALLVEEAGLEIEDGYRAATRLLARAAAVSAVFTTNVPVAMGALAAIREAGLTVPADMSVVSLHDSAYAERTEPPLTTVRMPLREMGREAARRLIELVRGGGDAPPVVLPPVGLQVRRSAAPPGRHRTGRRRVRIRRSPVTPHLNGGTRS